MGHYHVRLRIIELPRDQTLLVFDKITPGEAEDFEVNDFATAIGNNIQGGTVMIFEQELEIGGLDEIIV